MHPIAIPGFATERSRLMRRFAEFDARTTAVIVVDMQHGFVAPGAPFASAETLEIVPAINRIVHRLREAGATICWSRHTSVGSGPGKVPEWQLFEGSIPSVSATALRAGAPDWDVYAGLDVATGDLVFDKYRYSCFVNAAIDFDAELKARGIATLVVVGTVTNCCCESTARDAYMRDYQVYFVADATAAVTDEEHVGALTSIAGLCGDVLTAEALLARVPARAAAHA